MRLTGERLREVLAYDRESGVFTRRTKTRGHAIGQPAGCTRRTDGYLSIGVDGASYLAHRLAWLHETGEWPAAEIDHINGLKGDNRIANLRVATRSENAQNIYRAHSNSASGVLGVSWCAREQKWRAVIKKGGRSISLGYFGDIDSAAAAYGSAKSHHHQFAAATL
ncbi:MAG: HNH endonuclease [Planctomycetota bacterium]